MNTVETDYGLYDNILEPKLETTSTTFTKIEFNKNTLFFRSEPNKISFDKVRIKNIGTTCIYFKWQKLSKPFVLPEKRSDGIDRFFCHYADSKLFPDEEREFVFSFFSEKNGVFNEDWVLVTSPPIKSVNLNLHLNGMCYLVKEKYSQPIGLLDNSLHKSAIKTAINEMVVDLISSIREEAPPLPDMSDPNVFKFYFTLYNKEYNVVFSSYIMKNFFTLLKEINHLTDKEEETFWNGSIDELKNLLNDIKDDEVRSDMMNKLTCLIHNGRRQYAEDSNMLNHMRNALSSLCAEFSEISLLIKDEMVLPPFIFDLITRQSLTDQELNKYKNDLNKKKDEFYKKTKKKPYKNSEEEEKELNEYRTKLSDLVKSKFLDKFTNIHNEKLSLSIGETVLYSLELNEDYVSRLSRIKSVKAVKGEAMVENKYVILRIDIDSYEKVYSDIHDEEGNVTGRKFEKVKFSNLNPNVLDTMTYLLNNGVKALLLLVDYGPKLGYYNEEYSTVFLKEHLEPITEQSIFFASNLDELKDFNNKIKEEELKDNSLIIFENLNFFKEECGYELIDDQLVNPSGREENLKLYSKMKFLNSLTLDADCFINDSVRSFDKMYPTVIDIPLQIRAMGNRLDDQFKRITDFFSINTPNYLLIIGDNEVATEIGRDPLESELGKEVVLDSRDDQAIFRNLLILNSIMLKFKEICIMGKLAICFIHFIQKKFSLDSRYNFNPVFNNLVKFILVKANLNKIKIHLPEDCVTLIKDEYNKLIQPPYDLEGVEQNYLKEIKTLMKREKIQKLLEAMYPDEDELNENGDYHTYKLEEAHVELLQKYKEKSISFNSNEYIEKFVEAQEIKKPSKIFKSELEVFRFNKSIYHKPIVFPQGSNNFSLLNTAGEQAMPIIPLGTSLDKSRSANTMIEEHKENSVMQIIQPVFNTDDYELIDYSTKTYDTIVDCIGRANCIMWLGKLSPSEIENMFDNYTRIVEKIHSRKKQLKEKFDEEQAEAEKKLSGLELKARKDLLNFYLKSKVSHEVIKENFKQILYKPGNNNQVEDLMEENEIEIDEEQFSHDMHVLIDYFVDDEFETLNKVLSGSRMPGMYGLSSEPPKKQEEEFDPKFLDEI